MRQKGPAAPVSDPDVEAMARWNGHTSPFFYPGVKPPRHAFRTLGVGGERDLERIEALIETHGQRVMRLLRRMLGDPALAEDAWQETWGAVWKALPRLRAGSDPWPFLRKTAERKAVDVLRGTKTSRLVTGSDPEPAVRHPVAAPAVDLSFLPAEQRECLALYFWGGLSVREIAAKLGVPEGTVKTWMFRGRERLRAKARGRKETP